MIWLLLASQLAAPVPTGVFPWFSNDDFPPSIRLQGGHYHVAARIVVEPDGTRRKCAIETSSGEDWLDRYSCGLIDKRAKLSPATWLDGSPAYGVFRTSVNWQTSGRVPVRADVRLSVDRLPRGIKSPAYFALRIAADELGRVVGCQAKDADQIAGLVARACAAAAEKIVAVPPTDRSGKPVRSVQTASVVFVRN